MPSEADTCRKYVIPLLQAAGWDTEPHSIAEQRTITDGRIVPVGKAFIRKSPKRVDYLLRYRRDFPLAVVEAKAAFKHAAEGVRCKNVQLENLPRHTWVGLELPPQTGRVEFIILEMLLYWDMAILLMNSGLRSSTPKMLPQDK